MTELGNFMHDTAHDIGGIRNEVAFIKQRRAAGRERSEDFLLERLNQIEQHAKDLMSKFDKFYIRNKDKF